MHSRGSCISEDESRFDGRTVRAERARAIGESRARRDDVVDEHERRSGNVDVGAANETSVRTQTSHARPASLRVPGALRQCLEHRAFAPGGEARGEHDALIEAALGSSTRGRRNGNEDRSSRERASAFAEKIGERRTDVAPTALEGENRTTQRPGVPPSNMHPQAPDRQRAGFA